MCPGEFVILMANTGGGLTYQWFNSGVPVAGATASTLFVNTNGIYTVFETNAAGCTATSIGMNISVNPTVAHITPTANDTFCAGASLTLNANIGAGLSYQWMYAGAGIPGAINAFYNATAAGNYKVVVTNAAGCSATDSITLYTHPSPTATITAGGSLSFCAGNDSVTLTGNPGFTYQWYNTGVLIPGATNVAYTASVSGTYVLVETNNLGCSGSSFGLSVFANPTPNTVIIAGGPTTFCVGSSVFLSVPSDPAYSYQWYDYGAPIPGATNASFVATGAGSYTVRVFNTVTGCNGISATPVVVVVVSSPAVVGLSPTSFCWGSSALLAIDIIGGTGISYQWVLDGTIIPGATNSTLDAGVPGSYSCILVIGGSCGLNATALSVTEYPLPNPIISWLGGSLVTQNYFISYQWYKNTLLLSGANTWTYTPTSNGSYTVRVVDTNGCQSMSDVYVLTDYTGSGGGGTGGGSNTYVNQYNSNNEIKIFPNPANSIVHIEASIDIKAILTGIDGRKLIEQNKVKDIDISGLADGAYMIMLYDDNGTLIKVEKLIKTGR